MSSKLERGEIMSKLKGSDVLKALMKDAEYSAQPEAVREAMQPFIEAIPEVLEGQLDAPVTLQSLMAAKFAFLRYCGDNQFISKVVAAMPEEALGWFDRDDLAGMMEGMFGQLLDLAESIMEDVEGFLASQGVTEAQIMQHPKGLGLNPEAFALYEAGRLTIGDILVLQPMVIVKNTN
jgi:uncharacterized protein (DUF3820 family)